ncbi:hypothetical protein [Streptomyces microflavus]|uniref:hypothetical protein n=1 Tax=Streptomyces microflavus TaxID=1919 RepID=UPI0038259555
MSNDNVAVLTTLNAAVLVIGTVQYTHMLRRAHEANHALTRERNVTRARLIDAMRQGVEPPAADLLVLRNRWVRQAIAPGLLSLLWFVICFMLLSSQLAMLRWIGTADAGPAPELARLCYLTTSGAIIVLVGEGFLASTARFLAERRKIRRDFWEQYSGQQREDLRAAIRAARPPIPVRTRLTAPTNPPAPQPTTNPPADPTTP